MCNAWNHSPGCTCGWGGDGHLGKSTGHYNRRYNVQSVSERLDFYPSYTDPNATCPVCGQMVYFYQSPYGGRVFFDELGPPWPKHACTDNTAYRSSRDYVYYDAELDERFRNSPTWTLAHTTKWQEEGWMPFYCTSVVHKPSGNTIINGHLLDSGYFGAYLLPRGRPKSHEVSFYIKGTYDWLTSQPYFVRRTSNSHVLYEIETFFQNKAVRVLGSVASADRERVASILSE